MNAYALNTRPFNGGLSSNTPPAWTPDCRGTTLISLAFIAKAMPDGLHAILTREPATPTGADPSQTLLYP